MENQVQNNEINENKTDKFEERTLLLVIIIRVSIKIIIDWIIAVGGCRKLLKANESRA